MKDLIIISVFIATAFSTMVVNAQLISPEQWVNQHIEATARQFVTNPEIAIDSTRDANSAECKMFGNIHAMDFQRRVLGMNTVYMPFSGKSVPESNTPTKPQANQACTSRE